MILLMDGVFFSFKKRPKEHSTVVLNLLSGFVLTERYYKAAKVKQCLITGVALCRLMWNLVMYGSNSRKTCLYDEN